MEQPLKLSDLIPEPSTFSLKSTGKTYRMRPFSVLDEEWLKVKFKDRAKLDVKELTFFELCDIAYHQMEEEDRKDLAKQSVTITNEQGDTQRIELGGVKLFYSLVAGIKEKQDLAVSICATLGISRPILDKIEREELQKKKNLEEMQSRQTGKTSSISSPVTTAGAPSTSPQGLSES